MLPEAALKWVFCCSASGTLTVCVFELLLTTSPARPTALPPRTKAPAVELNWMPANTVLAAKLLLLVKRVEPSKTNVEEGDVGRVPPQLAAVIQLLSAPPP